MALFAARRIAAALTAVLSLACGAGTQGHVDSSGYRNTEVPYRVLPEEGGVLMGRAWALENFYQPKVYGGKPSEALVEKSAPDYMTRYSLDTNGDGLIDFHVDRHLYDLRFEHREHDGIISLSSFPTSHLDREKRLEVFIERYLGYVGSTTVKASHSSGVTTFHLGGGLLSKVTSKQKVELAGHEALLCEMEIFDRDERKIDPDSAREKLAVLIFHPPFQFRFRQAAFGGLLVAFHRNSPTYFEEGLANFQNLLERIELSGRTGFRQVVPISSIPGAAVEPSSATPPEPGESLAACKTALEDGKLAAATRLCAECALEVLGECGARALTRAETEIAGSAQSCESLRAIEANLARLQKRSEVVSEGVIHACENPELLAARGGGCGRPIATPTPTDTCAKLARQGEVGPLKTHLSSLGGDDKRLCQRAIIRTVGGLAAEPGRSCTDLGMMKASLAELELKSARIEFRLVRCKASEEKPASSPKN